MKHIVDRSDFIRGHTDFCIMTGPWIYPTDEVLLYPGRKAWMEICGWPL